jgi:hypothetical protein
MNIRVPLHGPHLVSIHVGSFCTCVTFKWGERGSIVLASHLPTPHQKKKKKQLKKLTTLKETLEEGEINNRYLIIWVTILAATNKRLREDFGHLKKMKSSSDISLHTAMDVGVRFLRKLVRTCLSSYLSFETLFLVLSIYFPR